MKKGISSLLYLLFTAGSVTSGADVFACSCGASGIEEYYESAEYVLMAEILSAKVENREPVRSSTDPVYIVIEPLEVFKGDIKKMGRLYTDRSEGSCGVTVTVARQYVLFIKNDHISLCGGSYRIRPDRTSHTIVLKNRETLRRLRVLAEEQTTELLEPIKQAYP